MHRKKEHHEIPRVKEEHYHSEAIEHDEHHYDPKHMDEARVHHYKDIRKRMADGLQHKEIGGVPPDIYWARGNETKGEQEKADD